MAGADPLPNCCASVADGDRAKGVAPPESSHAVSIGSLEESCKDAVGAQQFCGLSELPLICPSLVMPGKHSWLAIPIAPLADRRFEVDALGLSGKASFRAILSSKLGNTPSVQILMHRPRELLAIVTPTLDFLDANGIHFGTLVEKGNDQREHWLLDPEGHHLLTVLSCAGSPDSQEMRIIAPLGGNPVECGAVTRCPAGKLPAAHYEVKVFPSVDAVLVLACFFAVVVFARNGKDVKVHEDSSAREELPNEPRRRFV